MNFFQFLKIEIGGKNCEIPSKIMFFVERMFISLSYAFTSKRKQNSSLKFRSSMLLPLSFSWSSSSFLYNVNAVRKDEKIIFQDAIKFYGALACNIADESSADFLMDPFIVHGAGFSWFPTLLSFYHNDLQRKMHLMPYNINNKLKRN